MSYLKYLEDQSYANGLPLRGPRLLLKPEEQEQITKGFDANVQVFDLTKPEDVKALREVEDKIVNRIAARLHPDQVQFDVQAGGWKVLVRWADVYGEIPAHVRRAAGG